MASNALNGLRDVDDVQGSFLLGPEGQLIARDLPAVFDAELFADVGPRIARLRETFDPSGAEATTLTLRFSDHKLHVRSLGSSLLCVLSGTTVNAPALRMAMNLVARRVGAGGGQHEDEVTTLVPVNATQRSPAPQSVPPAAPRPSSPPAAGAARKDVLYRGRRPG
ncbi:MAG TPA: roadblock/LC7 domain-containing protein [Polyangiaceae bacterium]